MGLSISNASIQTSLFIGTAYMTPLLGAWLADGYWGRYKTIMAFSILYAIVRHPADPHGMPHFAAKPRHQAASLRELTARYTITQVQATVLRQWRRVQGMFWMAATALVPGWAPQAHGDDPASPQHASRLQFALMYGALYTIAVGTGGIKPNVSSFGADQFDDTSRVERKQKQSFFNYFYFSINVGSLLAVTVIVKIQARTPPPRRTYSFLLLSCCNEVSTQ